MKNGKRPTKNQSIFIEEHGLNPQNWLICKDTSTEMYIVHKHSDKTTRVIPKGEKEWQF